MSKVIVFNGSPKKKGTTAALLAEVAKGAIASGAEIVEYDLNDKTLRGCQACMACRQPERDSCVQKDYFATMYADLKEAAGVVVGTPIYMGSITSQAWTLIDRLYPAMAPDFSPRYPGKKVVTVVTQGNTAPEAFRPAVESMQGFFKMIGWELVGDLLWPAAGGEPADELKAAAFAAGEKVAG